MTLVPLWIPLLLAQAGRAPAPAPAPAPEPARAEALPRFVPPPVSDPLLTAPPRAEQVVASFDEALGRLRAGSETLAIGAARAQAAAAQSRLALAALLPLLQGTASATYDLLHPGSAPVGTAGGGAVATGGAASGVTLTSPLVVGQLSFQVPIIDVALWQLLAAARAGERAAGATLADTERTLMSALVSTLLNVMGTERTALLQREGLRSALEREYLVTRTLELGSGTRLDLVRAQQDTRLARADVLSGREQVAVGQEALTLLLGGTRTLTVDPGLTAEALLGAAERRCHTVPVAQRPDVLAARLRQQAAREGVEAGQAEYLPSLGLQSSTAAVSVDPGPFRVPSWTVAAVLNVPIWDGGGRGARLAGARAQALEAAAQASLTGRQAEIDARRSRRGVTVATALLEQARGARDLAREADTMTRRSFETGVATSFELVQSAQALRQAELVLAGREFELASARFAAVVSEASCDVL